MYMCAEIILCHLLLQADHVLRHQMDPIQNNIPLSMVTSLS